MSFRMPPRGDETAPTFDPAKPRELRHFFSELEYHFSAASITDNTAKKQHATRYLDFDVADIWNHSLNFRMPQIVHGIQDFSF